MNKVNQVCGGQSQAGCHMQDIQWDRIGLPFMHTSKSGLLFGVGDDAVHVAEHIDSRTVTNPRI